LDYVGIVCGVHLRHNGYDVTLQGWFDKALAAWCCQGAARKGVPMRQYRQGDVILVQVRSIPKDIQPVKARAGQVVLAEGEVTGHHHILHGPQVTLFRPDDMPSGGIGGYIKVGKPGATLRHDEHDDIAIEPGYYTQAIQVEDNNVTVHRVYD
jgi:hypothetical protein